MNNTQVRMQRSSDARLLSRAARLFLVWGDRKLADYAHCQARRASVEAIMRALNKDPITSARAQ